MKKIAALFAAGALVTAACQPPQDNSKLIERIDALEKKVAALEKRPAAPTRPAPEPQKEAYKIPVGESPILGKKDAKVNVVVFSDYQCPYCSRADTMLREIIGDADLKAKTNLVFKHFPLSFHKDAMPASKAALAAREQGEEAFWKMSEKLFANQRDLKPENFTTWAKEIGLNVKKFEQDLQANDSKYEAQIKADMMLGQSSARVRGTPSIFVNGWELKMRSVDGVKELIKEKNLDA